MSGRARAAAIAVVTAVGSTPAALTPAGIIALGGPVRLAGIPARALREGHRGRGAADFAPWRRPSPKPGPLDRAGRGKDVAPACEKVSGHAGTELLGGVAVRLCEADGKALLAAHGIPVPRGVVLPEGAAPGPGAAADSVVKAQLLAGGRGKGGLVVADHADLPGTVALVRNRMHEAGLPPVVLLEERLDIRQEYYLALVLDDVAQEPRLLFSARGGVAVEDEAGHVRTHAIDPARGLMAQDVVDFLRDAGAAPVLLGRLSRLAADLYRVMLAEDAELIEVNPLAVTAAGRLVAADAKVDLDDSAAFRHPSRHFAWSERLGAAAQSPLERDATRDGFTFVEMPGNVAMLTAGAGLGMMVIDLLADAGFRPACFFDNAAGSRQDTTEARLQMAFRRAEAAEVRAILFYQTLATRDLKPRIDALLALLDASPPPKPLYFGLSASYVAERQMTAEAARTLMEARGFPAERDPARLVARMAADRDAGRLAV